MRLVTGTNSEVLIITADNNLCALVGRRPETARARSEAALISDRPTSGVLSACANWAQNLQRFADRMR